MDVASGQTQSGLTCVLSWVVGSFCMIRLYWGWWFVVMFVWLFAANEK